MIGDKIATMKSGARTDLPQICVRSAEVSQTQAAAMLNVGVRSIQKARTVRRRGVAQPRSPSTDTNEADLWGMMRGSRSGRQE
jgi:hypothetical protein